jgi:hypothetical protein
VEDEASICETHHAGLGTVVGFASFTDLLSRRIADADAAADGS